MHREANLSSIQVLLSGQNKFHGIHKPSIFFLIITPLSLLFQKLVCKAGVIQSDHIPSRLIFSKKE